MSENKQTIAYKGFSKDLTCRDFQYEIGKTYEIDSEPKICSNGFHACENPLDVFCYYGPASSRFAKVYLIGGTDQLKEGDSKLCSSKITIDVELSISDMVSSAIEYVSSKAKKIKGSHTRKDRGASSATGDYGASSATGNYSASSATGYRGASSATGNYSASSATGDYGAAMASGYKGKAMASEGSAIFLVERDDKMKIINVFAGIAGKDGIKPGVFYELIDGKPSEVNQ